MIPQIKRILYTTDLSDSSLHVFKHALNFAQKHDAGITILHVLEPLSPTVKAITQAYLDKGQVDQLAEDRSASAKGLINEQLKTLCETDFKDDPACAARVQSIELRAGFPAEMILSMADELNCDAVVMGTHGKGFIRNTFLGSTSKRVLRRTRKPVFIIPLPKEKADF